VTGLEQIEAMIEKRLQPPICDTLRFALVDVSRGRAVFKGTPGTHVYNPNGAVQGGYAATLLDAACGCAVHTMLSEAQSYTTLDLNVSYLRGISRDTGEVTATGTVVKFGRRTAFARAELVNADGDLLASATSTLLVMDRG
jgi:uncharacterized protein (TIGR00369 family)